MDTVPTIKAMRAELKRLHSIIRERDEMIDELLARLNKQHEHLVFEVENRTPVD